MRTKSILTKMSNLLERHRRVIANLVRAKTFTYKLADLRLLDENRYSMSDSNAEWYLQIALERFIETHKQDILSHAVELAERNIREEI